MRVAILSLVLACSPEPDHAWAEPLVTTDDQAATAATAAAAAAPTAPRTPASATEAMTGGADRSASADANTRGYRAYKAGDLDAAVQAFREAVQLDDGDALAHYNLACTLALLRRQGRVCQYGATEAAILDHLERAVHLDPARRQRMRQDHDLDDLRDTIRYRLLDGIDPTTDAGLEALLTGVELFGPPQGVYGSVARLRLEPHGRAVISRRSAVEGGPPGDWSEQVGSWSVHDGVVHIDAGGDIQDLRLSAGGVLGTGGAALWFDSPPECAA